MTLDRSLCTLAVAALTVVTAATPARADLGGSYHCRVRVHGTIEDRYLASGAESGPLGCPLASERAAWNGGRYEDFAGGSIYWSPDTGAVIVKGAIHDHWYADRRCIGYPLADEGPAADGGRTQSFQNGHVWLSAAGDSYSATC
ncbi:hypothetical protein [Actinoplanes sp. NPDC051851]|uniref:LGFP repeat-containing protein n=1 Tax=Actinoplanes sp. NPDC051851 TaxID=3154753 RepID=UPI003443CF06